MAKKLSPKRKFEKWLKKENNDAQKLYLLSALVFLCAIILALVFIAPHLKNKDTIVEQLELQIENQEEKDCEFRRNLDGVCVEKKEDISPALVGVMIENNIEARPLSGLIDARIVYETPVEGNITRFLAIYIEDQDVDKVGPVRSVRPYYLDWITEYGTPMYMHVGGSPEALTKIDNLNIFDVNEFFRGWYFWRSKDRYAPHNTYTSSKLWQKAWQDYGEDKREGVDKWSPWQFAKSEICTDSCATEITTVFRGQTYAATWSFNSSTKKYERYELGSPHLDRESAEQITTDTLIVQKVKTKVLDDVGRLRLETVNSGEVIIFQNGHIIEGIWKKGRSERTIFFDQIDDSEIKLNPGKIWIATVPQDGSVEWK